MGRGMVTLAGMSLGGHVLDITPPKFGKSVRRRKFRGEPEAFERVFEVAGFDRAFESRQCFARESWAFRIVRGGIFGQQLIVLQEQRLHHDVTLAGRFLGWTNEVLRHQLLRYRNSLARW